MKAKELLNWIVKNQIDTATGADIIEIPEGDDIQSQKEFLEVFFGAKRVNRHIPAGDYFYIWSDVSEKLLEIADKSEMILNDGEIYLFRIED